MILTDGVHLVSTICLTDLHRFARDIGLKREWFQDGRLPHYDLTTARMALKAEREGAERVSSQRLVKRMVRWDGPR